jgi:hypothetical protein
MEITSATLVSLACLLSSGKTDQMATEEFAKNLTEKQVASIQQIVNSGACLPKQFENKIQPGVSPDAVSHSPTCDL